MNLVSPNNTFFSGPIGINFDQMLLNIQTYRLKKIYLKISLAKMLANILNDNSKEICRGWYTAWCPGAHSLQVITWTNFNRPYIDDMPTISIPITYTPELQQSCTKPEFKFSDNSGGCLKWANVVNIECNFTEYRYFLPKFQHQIIMQNIPHFS